MKNKILLLITGILFFALSCKTAQNTAASPEMAQAEAMKKEKKKKKEQVRGNSLIGELRKLPGVRVSGNDTNGTVVIGRGATSIKGGQGVLFVVNDITMGTSLPRIASSVNVPQIDKIRVLRDTDASGKYGIQGANGVIEITMRKN